MGFGFGIYNLYFSLSRLEATVFLSVRHLLRLVVCLAGYYSRSTQKKKTSSLHFFHIYSCMSKCCHEIGNEPFASGGGGGGGKEGF